MARTVRFGSSAFILPSAMAIWHSKSGIFSSLDSGSKAIAAGRSEFATNERILRPSIDPSLSGAPVEVDLARSVGMLDPYHRGIIGDADASSVNERAQHWPGEGAPAPYLPDERRFLAVAATRWFRRGRR